MRTYQAPQSVEGLIAALAAAPDATLIAGGQSLLPAMAEKSVRSGHLIDVGAIAALKLITVDADGAVIGAGAVMADLMQGPIAVLYPALAEAARAVGNHVVRGRSTLGGCLAWANPRAEMPMIMIAHDATIRTQHRTFPANRLMTGAYATILAPGEVILSIHVPSPPRMAFAELIPRNSTGRAIVAAACADVGSGDVRVTVAGLTDIPVEGLIVRKDDVVTIDLVREAIVDLAISEHFLSIDYRAAAAAVLIRRCRERLCV